MFRRSRERRSMLGRPRYDTSPRQVIDTSLLTPEEKAKIRARQKAWLKEYKQTYALLFAKQESERNDKTPREMEEQRQLEPAKPMAQEATMSSWKEQARRLVEEERLRREREERLRSERQRREKREQPQKVGIEKKGWGARISLYLKSRKIERQRREKEKERQREVQSFRSDPYSRFKNLNNIYAREAEVEIRRELLQKWLVKTLGVRGEIKSLDKGTNAVPITEVVQDGVRFRVDADWDKEKRNPIYGVIMVDDCPHCKREIYSKHLNNLLDVGDAMKFIQPRHDCPRLRPAPIQMSEDEKRRLRQSEDERSRINREYIANKDPLDVMRDRFGWGPGAGWGR